MSQENVDVVRQVVDAFNRQDWVAWASNWHPDAEWHDPPEAPGSGVHRGLDSIRRYFDELLEIAADGWNVEVDAIESVGPRCVLIRARSVVAVKALARWGDPLRVGMGGEQGRLLGV